MEKNDVPREIAAHHAASHGNVGNVIKVAAPVQIHSCCDGINGGKDKIEVFQKGPPQVVDVGVNACDLQGKAGISGAGGCHLQGFAFAFALGGHHGRSGHVLKAVIVIVDDSQVSNPAVDEILDDQAADGTSAHHQHFFFGKGLDGVQEALFQFSGLRVVIIAADTVKKQPGKNCQPADKRDGPSGPFGRL